MDVGNTNKWNLEHVMTKKEIIGLIDSTFPIKPEPPQYPGEVANRFYYQDGSGEIGIISSVSDAFVEHVIERDFLLAVNCLHVFLHHRVLI